jgi:hypothetical protein
MDVIRTQGNVERAKEKNHISSLIAKRKGDSELMVAKHL